MAKIDSVKSLEAWKKAMIVVKEINAATKVYPDDERFGLTAETRKTARSVPANIVEGKMRLSQEEYRRFISIALGSTGEIRTQLRIAGTLESLTSREVDRLEAPIEEDGRVRRGLERALA